MEIKIFGKRTKPMTKAEAIITLLAMFSLLCGALLFIGFFLKILYFFFLIGWQTL